MRTKLIAFAAPAIAAVAIGAVVLATHDNHEPVAAIPGSPTPGTETPGGPTTPPLPTLPGRTATPGPTVALTHSGLLDGVPMTEAEWNERSQFAPIAVMIDNHADAYPHYGLEQADVIYEALVEGGITRFMAVYWRQEADRIEPIRSARTPFVIWASELGAWYSHVGSAETDNAADAAGQMVWWNITDLDESIPGQEVAYYRDHDRYAPHNMATSTEDLRDLGDWLGFDVAEYPEQWLYKENGQGTANLPDAGGIEVNFSSQRLFYGVTQWHWDSKSNTYLRFANGGPAEDAETGKQLSAANVIVMAAQSYELETTHVVYEQIGEGPVQVFLDGKVIEGTWRKPDREARTRFYDRSGKEIALNRGRTFISLVPLDALVEYAPTVAGLEPFPVYQYVAPAADDFVDDVDDDFDDDEDVPFPDDPGESDNPGEDDEPTEPAGNDDPEGTPEPTEEPDPEPTAEPTEEPEPTSEAEPIEDPVEPEPTVEAEPTIEADAIDDTGTDEGE